MGNVIYPMWAECPMLTRMVIVGYPAMSMVFLMLASVSDETAWFVDSLFNCNLDNLMSGKTEPEFFDLRLPQHVHRRGGIPELVGDSPNLETWFGRQSSLCP
ncbi:Anaphase-promoting complex subunit 10 [Durusdinium trenchii]|uniref:Anaphase-promoting complex subunit 10 n=1 Tax=Durusdinium trenchii TaxID=1381693 RepID=A0ABP0HH18_9DINO